MNEQQHTYIAVIGRLVGDDEDTLNIFNLVTREQAIALFKDDMAQLEGYETHADMLEWRGSVQSEVFINQILASETEIKEL